MKVLALDQYSSVGGAQQCLLDLIPAFALRGWHTRILAPRWGGLHDEAIRRGASVGSLQVGAYRSRHKALRDLATFGFDLPVAAWQIRAAIQYFGADVVYVNGPRPLAAATLAAGTTPLVFHAHSVPEQTAARKIIRFFLRRSRATVITPSEFVLRSLELKDLKTPPRVICNGVADLRAVRLADPRSFRVGLIGRIAPEKGHLDFIEAARIALARDNRLQFHVFGAPQFSACGYEQQVRDRARGLPIQFHGWVNTVSDALAGLDLVVAPSADVDAAPRVVLEALSAEVPVVAYRSGGIPELIEAGVSGILTECNTAECLAGWILFLANHAARRARFAAAGRTRWARLFTLRRFQDEVCSELQAAASRYAKTTRL